MCGPACLLPEIACGLILELLHHLGCNCELMFNTDFVGNTYYTLPLGFIPLGLLLIGIILDHLFGLDYPKICYSAVQHRDQYRDHNFGIVDRITTWTSTGAADSFDYNIL